MSEVKYSLNGKSFKDFGVYVSESLGLVGLLETKNITQYDWAEYHGIAPDLRKPKFKERTIELKCFIRGNNWEELFNNFMSFVIGEFSKPGTQRIHVEPFGYKVLPYEVFMKDEVKPEKQFSDGEMFATFSLKFIEPNPIKRVLKTTLDTFKLSYEIDSETEIFFGDGTKQTGRGNVSLTKDYSAPSYENSGVSLVATSGVNEAYYEVYSVPSKSYAFQFSVEITLQTPKDLILYVIGRNKDGVYEAVAISAVHNAVTGKNILTTVQELKMEDYGKFIFKVLDSSGNEIPGITFSNPRIETAEVIGHWRNMLGKEKIIIIAGNIEDLKNIQTPAETIWQKYKEMAVNNINAQQVTINVSDTIPPANIATIDKNGLVGNTKSKEQLEVWQQEVEDRVEKMSSFAIKGEATPTSSPTPYNPTDYPKGLYEKWEVETAGTYINFKDSANQPIVINPTDLDKKFVYINVTNGVAKKELKEIPSVSAAKVFDPTNNVDPSTMKAIADRYDKGRNDLVLNSIKEFSTNNIDLNKGTINADKSITLTGLDAGFIVKEATLNENSETSIIYKENAASSVVFGFRALNSRHHVTCRYNTNGPNAGKLEIVAKNPLTSIRFSDTSNSNYVLGDILKLVIRRVGLTYIFQVSNITKGWSLQMEQVTTPLGVPYVAHSISNPFVGAMTAGSNVTVFEYRNYSNAKDIEYIIEGDSITFGQSATKEVDRWASKIKGNNLVAGGGADTTGYLKQLLPEIIKVNPKRALIMMGGNDIVFNIPPEVWKQNLRDIRNAHVNAGIEVIHCYPTPRPGAGQLIDFLKNEPLFKFDLKIDTNTPLMNGGTDVLAAIYDSGDGVHPSPAGHAKIAEIINASILIADPVYPDTFKSIDQHVEANSKSNFQKVINDSIESNQTEIISYGKGTDYATIANSGVWVGNKMVHKGGVLKSIILNALKAENYKFVIATYISDTVVQFTNTYIDIAATVGINEYPISGNLVLNANQNLFLSLNTSNKVGYTLNSGITDCEFCQTPATNGPDFTYTKNPGYAPWMINMEVQKGKTPFSVDEMMLKMYDLINAVGHEDLDFKTTVNATENSTIKYTKLTGATSFKKGTLVFGKVVVYKLTGGSISFTSAFVPTHNSEAYDPTKTNIISFWKEYDKVRYSIEVQPLEPIA